MFDLLPATKENMRTMFECWCALFLILSIFQWRSRRATGLPLAYAVGLSMIHASGAFAACFDYYEPRDLVLMQMEYSFRNTFAGFYVAVLGFGAFVLGSITFPIIFPGKEITNRSAPAKAISTDLAGTLALISATFFLFFGPIIRRIPSMASISSAGISLAIISLNLYINSAYRQRRYSDMIKWLFASLGLPLITIVFMGFASYGSQASVTVMSMFYRNFKHHLLGVIALVLLLFIGFTGYINYMRERNTIRASVWSGAGMTDRIQSLQGIITSFEFFNPYKQTHLEALDGRLNQNEHIGKSVYYIRSGKIGFAEGGTLAAAAVAWIPRILWPNKPATGGSGSVVSRYTGLQFAASTSVGVGQVMELYINWGNTSVVIGFFIFGLVMSWLDTTAGRYFAVGDYWGYTRWLLPGIGMLNPIGSSTEIVSSVAANAVFVLFLHRTLFARYYEDPRLVARRMADDDRPIRGSKYPYSMR